MMNLSSLQKTIMNTHVVSINWNIFDEYKTTERLFFVHHSVMKISTISLFPWTVFFLSCLCPLSLSFPPFLLHIYSDGPVDTVILKNAFHFRALAVFIVYVYNLAFLLIIFCFSSLNVHFTCCTLELIFLSSSTWRKNEANSSGHNIKSKYVIFLSQNHWKNSFFLTVFQRIIWWKMYLEWSYCFSHSILPDITTSVL